MTALTVYHINLHCMCSIAFVFASTIFFVLYLLKLYLLWIGSAEIASYHTTITIAPLII